MTLNYATTPTRAPANVKRVVTWFLLFALCGLCLAIGYYWGWRDGCRQTLEGFTGGSTDISPP